jgi:hypothetical protein
MGVFMAMPSRRRGREKAGFPADTYVKQLAYKS